MNPDGDDFAEDFLRDDEIDCQSEDLGVENKADSSMPLHENISLVDAMTDSPEKENIAALLKEIKPEGTFSRNTKDKLCEDGEIGDHLDASTSKADSTRPLHEQQSSVMHSDSNETKDGEDLINRIKAITSSLDKERAISESLRRQLISNQNERGEPLLYDSPLVLSEKLVKEGEKNIELALQLNSMKDELGQLKRQTEKFRQILLTGINNGLADVQKFGHVSLGDLLRIRLQERNENDLSAKPSLVSTQLPTCSSRSSEEVNCLKETNRELQNRCSEMARKLECCKDSEKKVDELKQKVSRLIVRTRNENEKKEKAADEVTLGNKKLEALSEHIEKLMVHLKYEAASKAKAVTELGRVCRELDIHKNRTSILEKKNTMKDRALLDLKEAGKILQDQLRLMDDKYLELRLKLDWSRSQTERVIKSKDDELKELKAKFALVSHVSAGSEKSKSQWPLLDQPDSDRKLSEPLKGSSLLNKHLSRLSTPVKRNASKPSALVRSVHFREHVLEKDKHSNS
mmetsp:Transcript_19175/g.27300  ORF Transcript_19175/g.27300 Transcript_19175/m.27300 type:complete len:516 (-) Transcript_19175:26-1573(-)